MLVLLYTSLYIYTVVVQVSVVKFSSISKPALNPHSIFNTPKDFDNTVSKPEHNEKIKWHLLFFIISVQMLIRV